jgi:hypothetical protein
MHTNFDAKKRRCVAALFFSLPRRKGVEGRWIAGEKVL